MTFYDVVSGDKPQNTKSLIVAELSGTCPNQPWVLSLLTLSYIIQLKIPCQMTFKGECVVIIKLFNMYVTACDFLQA